MKPIELEVPWLPGVLAITLWPFILYLKGHKTKCIQLHEYYHWNQASHWGVLPWYIAYLALAVLNIGKTADKHPMEVSAYKVQRGCEKEQHDKLSG